MTKILDGKKLAKKILQSLKRKIKKSNLKLRLAVILVGKDPVSQIFINQKEKYSQKIGIGFKLYHFPVKISQEKLEKEIKKIAKNQGNSGIVVQLPLPHNINSNEILNLIPQKKDIDCLSEKSLGKFHQGKLKILPPVVGAVSYLLKNYRIKVKGKNIVLVGSGRLVGLPLAFWILRKKGTLTVVNELTTPNISSFTKKADILISGVGKKNLIKGKIVKKGAIVIDCGTSYHEGKLVGDVDFKSCAKKASYITPVPGGVGPLTVACLLENLIKLHIQ